MKIIITSIVIISFLFPLTSFAEVLPPTNQGSNNAFERPHPNKSADGVKESNYDPAQNGQESMKPRDRGFRHHHPREGQFDKGHIKDNMDKGSYGRTW